MADEEMQPERIESMADVDIQGTVHPVAESPAIPELGYSRADDLLAIPERFTDAREVTNQVRHTTYAVQNLTAILQEDIAVAQATAAILVNATRGLQASVDALEKLGG